MSYHPSRRSFIQTSAAIGAGYFIGNSTQARASRLANDKIQFACVGVDGKGDSDSSDAAGHGDIVAVCDIDAQKLEKRVADDRFSGAQKFFDYREMYDALGDKIDAVTVSTPDHSHAPASIMAMKRGKHCFCQKPLTHNVTEARTMARVAKEMGVQTMMGNQGTANRGLRQAAALIQAGALGTVSEVHVWTNRPIWPQGGDAPAPKPVPENVHWDLWIGPAAFRPYADGYHPFAWRGFWDFGTGALGDMACHTVNMPFAGLNLRDPVSIQADTSGHDKNYYPKWSRITFEFPELNGRAPVTFKWYDGGELPGIELFDGFDERVYLNRDGNMPIAGCVVVGDEGKLFSPDDYGARFFMAEGNKLEVEFEESPGHFTEFAQAIETGKPAKSNFHDYAGPLTETILLGNLAVYAASEGSGPKVMWDAENMKASGANEPLDHIISYQYREGYEV